VSGRLWRNSLVMLDQETGTYWSHITGEAMIGGLKGEQLSTLPSVQTTWSEWISNHPGSQVLKKDKEILSSHYEDYFKDPDRTGLFPTKWLKGRLPGKKLIHGITLDPHALAVPDDKLNPGEFLQSELGEESVVVVGALDGGVRAFLAKVGEKSLTFKPGSKNGQYLDEETGSVWNLGQGICGSGKLKGEKLEELTVTRAFWFAWSNFYPNTKIAD